MAPEITLLWNTEDWLQKKYESNGQPKKKSYKCNWIHFWSVWSADKVKIHYINSFLLNTKSANQDNSKSMIISQDSTKKWNWKQIIIFGAQLFWRRVSFSLKPNNKNKQFSIDSFCYYFYRIVNILSWLFIYLREMCVRSLINPKLLTWKLDKSFKMEFKIT